MLYRYPTEGFADFRQKQVAMPADWQNNAPLNDRVITHIKDA